MCAQALFHCFLVFEWWEEQWCHFAFCIKLNRLRNPMRSLTSSIFELNPHSSLVCLIVMFCRSVSFFQSFARHFRYRFIFGQECWSARCSRLGSFPRRTAAGMYFRVCLILDHLCFPKIECFRWWVWDSPSNACLRMCYADETFHNAMLWLMVIHFLLDFSCPRRAFSPCFHTLYNPCALIFLLFASDLNGHILLPRGWSLIVSRLHTEWWRVRLVQIVDLALWCLCRFQQASPRFFFSPANCRRCVAVDKSPQAAACWQRC